MQEARPSVIVALVLILTTGAWADVSTEFAPPGLSPLRPCDGHGALDRAMPSHPTPPRPDQMGPADQLVAELLGNGGLPGGEPWGLSDPGCRRQEAHPVVRELPGLPSSAEMFLSAVLSLGAWHAVRKTRHINLSHLPDWYHPHAPLQIGETVCADLQFAPLAECAFVPSAGEQPVLFAPWRESRSRCESQFFFSVEAPRGPPLSAL